ncbi:calmodulin-like protein 4 isoform X1 [Artibeus jamaicensis]|uniref:calmodulin-like protein 4 isoform X1 n=1 Tax=Artibeus jamaicensis TaxID=9417 RepID=UPI00235B047A|nr:calmodulin-like protein 4 isoform X1 [Artibeus jamaicensis]
MLRTWHLVSSPLSPRRETGKTPSREAQGRAHSLWATAPFMESREGSQEGMFVRLLRSFRFPVRDQGPREPFCSPVFSKPNQLLCPALAGHQLCREAGIRPLALGLVSMAAAGLLQGPPPSLADFRLEARRKETRRAVLGAGSPGCSRRPRDEYKECFSLYDKQQRGKIKATDLLVVMRCLGASPTPGEAQRHLQTHGIDKNGELEFSTFLTIMHTQIKQEDPKKEILLAMLMADKEKKGYIMASELRSKLTKLGEKLTHKEVDDLFREANIEPNGKVKYDEFIHKIATPVRDY